MTLMNNGSDEAKDSANMKEIIDTLTGNSRLREGVAWKRRHVSPGETIIRKGEIGETVFFLESGQVRVQGEIITDENERINTDICDLSTWAMFGDVCLYEPRHRTATITALTDASLIEINSSILSIFLDDHPVEGYLFLRALFQAMVNRLSVANDRIDNLLAFGIKKA